MPTTASTFRRFPLAAMLLAWPVAGLTEEIIDVYGWQNHGYEIVDLRVVDHKHNPIDRSSYTDTSDDTTENVNWQRINSAASHIGFAAEADTGIADLSATFQCDSTVFLNDYAGGTGWCNRNSKIGLKHKQFGELMFGTWLLPYNAAIGTYVDPFPGVGISAHTSIMGSIGARTRFYLPGQYESSSTGRYGPAEFSFGRGRDQRTNPEAVNVNKFDMGFNRIQENLIQYISPYMAGFQFRYAQTVPARKGISRFETFAGQMIEDTDPEMEGYQAASHKHGFPPVGHPANDQGGRPWTYIPTGGTVGSGATSGEFLQVVDGAGANDDNDGFVSALNPTIRSASLTYQSGPFWIGASWQQHTDWAAARLRQPIAFYTGGTPGMAGPTGSHTEGYIYSRFLMEESDADSFRLGLRYIFDVQNLNVQLAGMFEELTYEFIGNSNLRSTLLAFGFLQNDTINSTHERGCPGEIHHLHRTMVMQGQFRGLCSTDLIGEYDIGDAVANAYGPADGDLTLERDAWMVSGKISADGVPVDFRFSYMEADDIDLTCTNCPKTWDNTGAEAWNVGLFYTFPAGTELRLTYSVIENDQWGSYTYGGQGGADLDFAEQLPPGSAGPGGNLDTLTVGRPDIGHKMETVSLGLVHYFD